MVGVTGNGITASFTYDGDGKRVEQVINNVTTKFIGNHYEIEGTTVRKYYLAGASRVAMRTGTNAPAYFLQDHLGSTSITTDSSGNLVSELLYKAWGEVRYTSGTTPTNYTYTGQYSNTADFGLMYYGARWYDPYINHFTQPDTIIPDPNNPQAYDRYSYALNNPIRYNDPSGHCAEPTTAPVCLALLPAGPIGWIFIGVLTIIDVVLIAVVTEDIVKHFTPTTSLYLKDQQLNTTSSTVISMKGEYIPDFLAGPFERHAYHEAIERYKKALGLPPNFDVPKSILDGIAEDINDGASAIDAADNAPEPPDGQVKNAKPTIKAE